jgi:hypothetical protein
MNAVAAVVGVRPSHCAGNREPMKNIHITGIQSASDDIEAFFESYRIKRSRRIE